MAAADGRHVERHFAIGTAADDGLLAVELEPRAGRSPFDKLQKCHGDVTAPIEPARPHAGLPGGSQRQVKTGQHCDRIRAERDKS